MTSGIEVIVSFLQPITFCKHSCVLLFSAQISLTLLLRRRQRSPGTTGGFGELSPPNKASSPPN